MLALYQATGTFAHLQSARSLAGAMVGDFYDAHAGSFFDTAHGHETLITRPRDLTDNATPSGSALACDVLLHLAVLDDVPAYLDIVSAQLNAVAALMVEHPLGFGHWLGVADRMVHGAVEVALVAASASASDAALLDVLRQTFVPTLVLARGADTPDAPALLRNRAMQSGEPTAFVCRGYSCELPTSDGTVLARQLRTAVRFTVG
jgi:uncharacterized protein